MWYTYVWNEANQTICLLDIEACWTINPREVSNCSGLKSTASHPIHWYHEYKKVSFMEFSLSTGVTIKDVLSVLQ